jgi:hypothetical protein
MDDLTGRQQALLAVVVVALLITPIGHFVLWVAWSILTWGMLWNLIAAAAVLWSVHWLYRRCRPRVGLAVRRNGVVRLKLSQAGRALRRRLALLALWLKR